MNTDIAFEVRYGKNRTGSRRVAYARRLGSPGPWLKISVAKADRMLNAGRAIEVQ